jgi:riboflavin biosynthesis pyrimidine reductase
VSLPPSLTLAYHEREPHPREISLEAVYRDLQVAGVVGRPAVIINMVQTLDGVVAVDGKAWAIGSEVDHYLFRTLRGWADAVLSGAGTLCENDVIPATHPHLVETRVAAGRPPAPAAVVVSRRAEFSDGVLRKRFFTRRESRSIVVTTEDAKPADLRRIATAGAEVIVVPPAEDGTVAPRALLDALAHHGIERVLAEGGPGLNRRLVEAGVVDELFLTVSARVAAAVRGAVAGTQGEGRALSGVLGGARAALALISELHYRTPRLVEWYLRFAVTPA